MGNGYPVVQVAPYQQETVHRVRAAKALGKPLPQSAVVHHADGSKSPDAPLVICENDSYHQLLHRRMRIKAAGGNPNTQKICWKCKSIKDLTEFGRWRNVADGWATNCRLCQNAYARSKRLTPVEARA